MTTNPPNVEATNVVSQLRYAQYMPVYCRGCDVRMICQGSKLLKSSYKCPQCGRTGSLPKPTEEQLRRYL